MNQCFKFSKYEEGYSFEAHIDGPWVPMKDESSVFTVVIYLNDDYEGGQTNFYNEPFESKFEGKRGIKNDEDLVATIQPKTGKMLVFNHESYHEGSKVLKGTKYIVRTEIMFVRIDSSIFKDKNLSNVYSKRIS